MKIRNKKKWLFFVANNDPNDEIFLSIPWIEKYFDPISSEEEWIHENAEHFIEEVQLS